MNKILRLSLFLLFIGAFLISKPELGSPIVENTTPKRIEVKVEGIVVDTIILENEATLAMLFEKLNLSSQANLNGFDLNQKLYDEMMIYIPTHQAKISLNKASKEELMQIKGIGEVIAQRILDYRVKQPFYFIEDIKNIKGIGQKKYLKFREYLCLSFFFLCLFLF